MWDLPDPEYVAKLFKAWPSAWRPPRLSLREGSSLSIEPAESGAFPDSKASTAQSSDSPNRKEKNIEVESLRQQLRDYIDKAKMSEAAIIKEIGINKKTFYDFLAGKTDPIGKTINTIREFLERKGKTA